MLAVLARYKLLFEIIAVGLLVAGALWGYHVFCENLREQGRAEIRAQDARVVAAKVEADRKIEALWNTRIQKAEQDATDRQNMLNAMLASSGKSLDGLQRTLASTANSNKQPNVSIDAILASNAAISAVFLDCATRYRDLGQKADGHVGDIKTLTEAWPKEK